MLLRQQWTAGLCLDAGAWRADTAAMASSLFPGFTAETRSPAGVPLFLRRGGGGPPLLLLHGHPQTHAMWHRLAPALAQRFTLVMPDLRGYGRSGRVTAAGGGSDPSAYARRVQAAELHALMRELGHTRYGVLAHDRGARAAHRLALDEPQAVQRLMLLDIAPTLAMYEHTGEAFARAYWHWFFLIQPPPLPERLIEADPAAYLRDVMGRRHAGLAAFHPAAWADYKAGIQRPGSAQAVCDDYRAAAGIDLEHDRASRAQGQRLVQPLAVRWGAHGTVARCFDLPALWREAVADARQLDAQAWPCGHYIAEEQPEALLADATRFFQTLET
jgi:haloacetate dehalogenase